MIKFGLNLEEYFVLYCVLNNNNLLLESYIKNIKLIDFSNFNHLIEKGYIEDIQSEITFDKLKLTNKFYKDFNYEQLDYERLFKELLAIYPKRIGKRPLHNNLSDCKKKYKSIINSEIMHQKVLKCVKLYVKDLKDSGKLDFIQLLSTWLNQRNFEQYIDDVDKVMDMDNNVNYDAI